MTPAERRTHLERTAATLFVGATITMATVCGAIIVSGYFAGVIQDTYERVFWLGAVLAGLMVATFAAAAFPGGADDVRTARRITVLLRVALVLFVLSPTFCLIALVLDFFA